MTPVDRIPPVYIRADRVSLANVVPEYLCFMSACVGSQHCVLINVVGIGATSARMIYRKAEGIEILSNRDDWMKTVVVGVRWFWETSFYELAGYAYRMGRL